MVFSVVIPLYNKQQTISRALDSVLTQTFNDFEVIVVDDGSTDDGPKIVQQYHDARVSLVRQKNAGVSAARNRGIDLARGELIAFLDSDDEWCDGFLQAMLDLRERFPHAGVYASAYKCSASGDLAFRHCPGSAEGGIINNYPKAACCCSPLISSAIAIPSDVIRKVGGFPMGVRLGEDSDTWYRIALYSDIAWTPRVLAIYYNNIGQNTRGALYVGDASFAPIIGDGQSGSFVEDGYDWTYEYLVNWRLNIAFLGTVMFGSRMQLLRMLYDSRRTRVYKKRLLICACLSLIPSFVLRWLYKAYRLARYGSSEVRHLSVMRPEVSDID